MEIDNSQYELSIPLEIDALLGRKLLHQSQNRDFVSWAENQLVKGKDSKSLAILAGLEAPYNTFEIEKYFKDALVELGVNSKSEEILIENYAKEIAQNLVEGKVTPETGVNILSQIFLDTDQNQKYLVWYRLGEAKESLKSKQHPWSYEDLNDTNFEKVVIENALDFLALDCP